VFALPLASQSGYNCIFEIDKSTLLSALRSGAELPSFPSSNGFALSMSFRIDLDSYRGPMDLLLYLVRKHEVDICDIPIAEITEQFLSYLEVLKEMDVNFVGDFLDLASTLIELKSRMVLPKVDEEVEEVEDPRNELVARLLEYKKYKDAASVLEEKSREWQQRFPRMSDDLPPRKTNPASQPIQELELWDLVSAFGRIVRDRKLSKPSSIVYDETPIHVYMSRIHDRMKSTGEVAFSEMFQGGMHKSALIGVFLAILELVRHHSVTTKQANPHGEIWVVPGEQFEHELNVAKVDNYGGDVSDLPSDPR
jgi:segregation and condensation protein A